MSNIEYNMCGRQAHTATAPLTVLLGHSGTAEAVAARLDERRPHVRWSAPIGYGKSTSLRVAVTELATQIAVTGHPRMYLFDTDCAPYTFGGLQQLPGVTVVAHEHQVDMARILQAELDDRIAEETIAPLVIAIDDYHRAVPVLQNLVESIENDHRPGVHLALASSSLGDFQHRPDHLGRADYFKELVRQQIYSGPETGGADGWDELAGQARVLGIGWRPPRPDDRDVIMYGIGSQDSDIRFGVWEFTSRIDKYMYYDVLSHPDKYTTVVLGSLMQVNRYMPFIADYPELDCGEVAFAATSGAVAPFLPTPVEVQPDHFERSL